MSRRNSFTTLRGFALFVGWLLLAGPHASAVRSEEGIASKDGVTGKRAPQPAATITPTQASLVRAAKLSGIDVTWNFEGAVPLSVRGKDLGAKAAYSAGRGLVVRGQGRYAEDAVAVMDNLAGMFRISDAAKEFNARKTQGDSLGFNHVRLQQKFQELLVVGGEVIVHFNKAGKACQVNGRYIPDLAVSTAPALTAAKAISIAQADIGAMNKPVGELAGEPTLVVYARQLPPRLAYELTLTYKDAKAGPGRWRYWVDAMDGSILQRFNDIQTIPAPTANGIHNAVSGSILAGEGGGTTNVTGWYDNVNTNYYLYNTNFHWIIENVAASGYSDANTYAFRSTNDWGASDRTEMSLAQAFDLTQQYYNQVHGLNSFNSSGIIARANAHEGTSYVNAYWDGSEFYFGDGDGATANSLAVLDVAGHEYTHAVTEYSAELVYAYESGALNESFSDIFGACIEFFGQADDRASYPARNAGMADWLCGEDCWLESTALRDLRNPANSATVGAGNEQPTRYLGTYWYAGSGDNGGVHQNSGVQNFFFYLLSDGGSGTNDGIIYNVTGIGITNAGRVAYLALTAYCTADTDYRAARAAWIAAAQELNSAWVPSVCAAWDAVGVQAVSISPSGDAAFSGVVGGPFSPSTFVYTITNADSSATGWGVSHTQTWATVAPENGSIPAFGSQAVTVTLDSAASELPVEIYVDTVVFTNSTSASSESRSVTLRVLPPVVYEFDLNTDPGWTTGGQWAYGMPLGLGGDPSAGVTGTNVYGYNLSGAYPDDMPVYALTTLPLDCSKYENLQLSFWRWLGVEDSVYDSASIQISTNGTDWADVWVHTGVSFQDESWQSFIYTLEGADGQSNVYLRWLMGPTDYSMTYSGWNIDDIRIHGTMRDDMRVSPAAGLTAQGYEGGPFSPTSQTYSVVNGGTNTFDWTASTTDTWFSVSSAGGSLAVGATAIVSVALNPAADAFVPGQHQGAVIFSNSTSGFASSRAIELTVLAIPGEIGVTDSIAPDSDLNLPFGNVIVGWSRTESITITNSDDVYPIVLSRIGFESYLEDFDDGLAQGWSEDVDANWNVVSGEYQAQSPAETWMLSMYGGKSWNDVTAQMSCRRTGATSPSAALVLRATADFDDEVGSAYVFQISLNGQYGIWKQVAGSWSWLQDWTTSSEILSGVNVLRATAQGTALSFYINGTLVWSGSDSSLAGGLVGVGGFTAGATTHYFDEVVAGATLPTIASVSEAQVALNAHTRSEGDRRVAPAGVGVVPRAPASVGAQMIAGGVYCITNEPASFPYSIPAHSSITFNVIYTPTAIASNAGEVVIECNDTSEPDVHVTLSGHGILDYLEISPSTGLVSSGHPGGPFTPTSAMYSLTNSSGISITWAVANTQTWATVDPAGGTLGIGEAQSVTVSITAAATSLGEGVYQDTVIFSNLSTGVIQARPATLTVFTSPQVGVSPAEMWVTNKSGHSQVNVLTVSNGASADGTLTFRLTSRSTGQTPLPFRGGDFVSRIEPGHDLTRVEPGRDFVPGELLVRFAGGVTASARASLLSSLGGGTIQREYHIVPGLTLIKLPPGATVENALAAFNRASGVVYASPNYILEVLDTYPDDARFAELWGMNNTGQLSGTVDADIDAPAAWDMQTGGTGIVVAVIDTGIDYNHEDLSANMWVNPGEIPGNLLDDDGNGYTDDVHGINAILMSGDPLDDHDHGTHCAGTIGGFGNNGVGVAGVNWRVRLMALKFLDSGGSGDTADAITCVEYATDKGAKVLSNSWGGGGYEQALKDAIDAAGEAGILFAAAAGNDSANNDTDPHYPSSYESTNIVAVMATDRNDVMSTFSSYGQTTVDLAAPGTDILSCKRGGGYQEMSGTSMATPHIAGAAALLWSVSPSATVAEVKQAMMSSVDVLFPTLCVSGGRLNLERAIGQMSLSWLTLDPTGATNLPAGSSTNIQVGFHAGELEPAVYHGEIVVSCNDVTNPVVVVPVTMTIVRDALRITPSGVYTAAGVQGGPFVPPQQVYVLSNAGVGSVTWSLSHTSVWLAVSSSGGSLAPEEVIAVTATIDSVANGLLNGDYADEIVFSNESSGVALKRYALLSIAPPSPDVIYNFPLDTDPGWTPEGQWAFGKPAGGGSHCGDPATGHTGTNVYGYNLAGDYPNSIPSYYLTTGPLDCSAFRNIQVQFWRWLGVEPSIWDHVSVEVSTNGSTWSAVWENGPVTVCDGGWTQVTYSLTEIADTQATVYIRWKMGSTDSIITYPGWNIDDICVLGNSTDPLVVMPTNELSARGFAGGPFAPTGIVYTLQSYDSVPLNWSVSCTSSWLLVTPASGTLPIAGSATDVLVAFSAAADSLTSGTYFCTVVFSNANTGKNFERDVDLSVSSVRTNLLHNPSFETAGSTAQKAAYWEWNNPDQHGSYWGTASRELWRHFPENEGGWCGALRGNWAGDTSGGFWQEVPAVPGGQYIFSAWLWADDGHPEGPWTATQQGLKMEFYSYSTNYSLLKVVTQNVVGVTQAWQQVTLCSLAPTGCDWVRVVVFADGVGSSGALQLDALSLEGSPPGLLVLPLTDAQFSGLNGGPFLPPTNHYEIANLTPGALAWTAGCTSNWVSVTPDSGTLPAGATTNIMVVINANANTLGVGAYNATVVFSNGTDGLVHTRVVALTVQDYATFDSDGDQMPDSWETKHGLNPSVSNAPTANADGDWMTDIEEYVANTHPTDTNSFFPSIVLTDSPIGILSLVVDPTSTARVYGVHWTTNLMLDPQVWILYPPEQTGTGSGVVFTITNGVPARSYRTGVRLP